MEQIKSRIEEENKPFDIEKDPLIRCFLYQISPKEHILHFGIHHIILDGTGAKVFLDDLLALYDGKELPPIDFDFQDYAKLQASRDENEDKDGENYFKKMFEGGVPENEMPSKYNRPEILPFVEAEIHKKIKKETIEKAASAFKVTRYNIMTAALGITLGKYCGSEDVVIGTAMSGRNNPQEEKVVGMFVNMLPVRLKFENETLKEYVQKTAQTLRDVKTHQTYPFEKLVPLLAPDRNTSALPYFDVIF